MMPIFRTGPETPRLLHRAMVADDAKAVFAFNGNEQVMALTGEPIWESVAQTRERLEAYEEFERRGFGRWGVVYKPEGRLIGFSGFKYVKELGEVDLGYRLLPEYWGRGLATESCRACLRFGFERMGLERVNALVLPENGRSLRVLNKAGFRDTGIINLEDERVHRFVVDRDAWLASL